MTLTDERPTAPSEMHLVNPETGRRFDFTGWWLRGSPATATDVRLGRARFIGAKVWMRLPPGVQAQFDKGVLQLAHDYEVRRSLEATLEPEGPRAPAGNASREAWIGYAVSQGMPADEAAALSRDQIRQRFAAPVFDPDAPPVMDDPKFDMLNDKP